VVQDTYWGRSLTLAQESTALAGRHSAQGSYTIQKLDMAAGELRRFSGFEGGRGNNTAYCGLNTVRYCLLEITAK
jgi:hypothetical protein